MSKFISMIMIYGALLGVVLVVACEHNSYHGQDITYLPILDEISLPQGFAVQDDDVTVFDTAAGRIVDVTAHGPLDVSTNNILTYYTITLPQLGWQLEKGGTFSRGNETLTISPETLAQSTRLQFRLEPKSD